MFTRVLLHFGCQRIILHFSELMCEDERGGERGGGEEGTSVRSVIAVIDVGQMVD